MSKSDRSRALRTLGLAVSATAALICLAWPPSNGLLTASSTGSVASWCHSASGTDLLNQMFDGDPAGIIGSDYQRTLALPDGRVLWTFQDPLVYASDGQIVNLHNAAVVQNGNCFEFLRSGTAADPQAWLLADLTDTGKTWFWPMASTLNADEDTVHVFLAQMRERSADGYLVETEPLGVVIVNLDATSFALTGGPFVPSWGTPNSGDRTLYGWSVEAAGNHTYLLGHCHRQFGYDPFFNDTFIHDSACAREVRLARVPRGDVFAPLEYWTGTGWSTNRFTATALLDTSRGNVTNPSQLQYVNGQWIAATKIDDWWSDQIVIDQANKVTGPWRQTASIQAIPKCAATPIDFGCNTYFASFVDDPARDSADPVILSLSHNLWSGEPSSLYRPTYFTIDPPAAKFALADRCSLDEC